MSRFSRHFFVCQNERPPLGKPSCGVRGGKEILELLQEGLARHTELWSMVTVTGCACLGPCFDGPMMVVYPEGTWYANVQPADVKEIVESHMAGGKVVERLLYRWPAY